MNATYKKARKCAAQIARRIGGRKVIDDPDRLEKYSHDESGQPAVLPVAVVLPENASEVAAALKIASGFGVHITPRGGGTGKCGGAIPSRNSIVICMEKMNAVEEISTDDFVAVVRPGLVLRHFHDAVEERGLFYPPDPASLESCTLGGNVAANAGGPRAFRYGVTSHYVLSLELAMMDGTLLKAGARPIKQAAGYAVATLLTGSEGTLAVITRAVLRLLPLPDAVTAAVATFESPAKAASVVGNLLRSGLTPRVMEFMDLQCMKAMEEHGKVHFPQGAESAVFIEVDGSESSVEAQIRQAGDIMEDAGAREVLLLTGAAERNAFWDARRKISEILKEKYPYKITDDVSVPRGRIPEAIEKIYQAARRGGMEAAIYGHAGDGNLHVNLLSDGQVPSDRIVKVRDEIMHMVIEMDGAVSGEHGVGTTKRRYLKVQQGKTMAALQRKLKEVFDPKGLLNRGKVIY